jgi:hypothetical protein
MDIKVMEIHYFRNFFSTRAPLGPLAQAKSAKKVNQSFAHQKAVKSADSCWQVKNHFGHECQPHPVVNETVNKASERKWKKVTVFWACYL